MVHALLVGISPPTAQIRPSALPTLAIETDMAGEQFCTSLHKNAVQDSQEPWLHGGMVRVENKSGINQQQACKVVPGLWNDPYNDCTLPDPPSF